MAAVEGTPNRCVSADIAENGTLYTWGTAVYGQHGNVARCFPSPVPMQALRNIPVRRVACGRYHVGAVTGMCSSFYSS